MGDGEVLSLGPWLLARLQSMCFEFGRGRAAGAASERAGAGLRRGGPDHRALTRSLTISLTATLCAGLGWAGLCGAEHWPTTMFATHGDYVVGLFVRTELNPGGRGCCVGVVCMLQVCVCVCGCCVYAASVW